MGMVDIIIFAGALVVVLVSQYLCYRTGYNDGYDDGKRYAFARYLLGRIEGYTMATAKTVEDMATDADDGAEP